MELDQRLSGEGLVDMSRNEAMGIRQGALDNELLDQTMGRHCWLWLVRSTTLQVRAHVGDTAQTGLLIQRSRW